MLWPFATTPSGYGKVWDGKRLIGAHRFAYTITLGSISEGLFVCHRCDVPRCYRPEHLFSGTAKDNSNDMFHKTRQHIPPRGESHPISKLTDVQVDQIYEMWAAGYTEDQIGETFAVEQTNINSIVRGKTWAHRHPLSYPGNAHIDLSRRPLTLTQMGERNVKAKLTEEQVLRIHDLRASGLLQREIAQMMNVATVSIKRILRGTQWAYLHPKHRDKPEYQFSTRRLVLPH